MTLTFDIEVHSYINVRCQNGMLCAEEVWCLDCICTVTLTFKFDYHGRIWSPISYSWMYAQY